MISGWYDSFCNLPSRWFIIKSNIVQIIGRFPLHKAQLFKSCICLFDFLFSQTGDRRHPHRHYRLCPLDHTVFCLSVIVCDQKFRCVSSLFGITFQAVIKIPVMSAFHWRHDHTDNIAASLPEHLSPLIDRISKLFSSFFHRLYLLTADISFSVQYIGCRSLWYAGHPRNIYNGSHVFLLFMRRFSL